MNIGSLLPRHARYRGDHPALVVGDRRLSYRELNRYVNRLANALLGAGLRKGDKFATVLPNCLELMAAYWAAAQDRARHRADEPAAAGRRPRRRCSTTPTPRW